VSVIVTFLVWLPFIFSENSGLKTLVANFDGPYYIAVAKSFYDKEIIRNTFSFPVPLEYYPAHFPLFPALIRLLSPIAGYGYGLLLATLVGSILAAVATYELLKDEGLEKAAMVGALASLILPARWLVVRSIGSPEPWFIFFIVTSLILFRRKNYWLAGILGALATLTKSPGVLLFVVYMFSLGFDVWYQRAKITGKMLPIILIPLSLVALFGFYQVRMGDFLAYFHSGDNIHLTVLPFAVFNSQQPWVGTFWLEDIIYIYLFGGLTLIELIRQKRKLLAWFTGTFLTTLFFVSHRDLARYSLPLAPMAIVAFAPYLCRKEVKFLLLFLSIPIYLYTINFIANNVLAIPDWTPFL
jgi:hypothetical protein